MLTTDLLSARVYRGEVRPRYVDPRDDDRLALARRLIEIFEAHAGHSRGELESELRELTGTGTEFLFHRALAKLLSDRCEFDTEAAAEPEEIRRAIFEAAATAYAGEDGEDEKALHFDRTAALERAAQALELESAEIERGLYADLKDEQVLQEFRPCRPEWLLDRYNVALAQGILLRALELKIELRGLAVRQLRALFQKIKFFQLLHRVESGAEGEMTLHLDGPFSLFKSSQKYGLQMAFFLPTLLHFEGWKLEAEVVWGKKRQRRTFRLSPEAGLRPISRLTGQWQPEELSWLPEQFAELESEWRISTEAELVDLGGEGILVPDYVFSHEPSGFEVTMEVLGFWRKGAVASRLRLLRRHGPENMILAISKQLAGGEEEELEALPGEVYVFRSQPIARRVLKRLEKLRGKK